MHLRAEGDGSTLDNNATAENSGIRLRQRKGVWESNERERWCTHQQRPRRTRSWDSRRRTAGAPIGLLKRETGCRASPRWRDHPRRRAHGPNLRTRRRRRAVDQTGGGLDARLHRDMGPEIRFSRLRKRLRFLVPTKKYFSQKRIQDKSIYAFEFWINSKFSKNLKKSLRDRVGHDKSK